MLPETPNIDATVRLTEPLPIITRDGENQRTLLKGARGTVKDVSGPLFLLDFDGVLIWLSVNCQAARYMVVVNETA